MKSLILGSVLASVFGEQVSSPFWPQPLSFSVGSDSLSLSNGFTFQLNQESAFLDQAVERYQQLIGASSSGSTGGISACSVTVDETHDDEPSTLQLGVDESYELTVSKDGECTIHSSTVWGSLRAFETFTQLLSRSDDGTVTASYLPVDVSDDARFTHRGFMLDSSRHYLPVSEIQRMVDTLVMSKFNVLHWHMVDAQSFPVDTPSAPDLVKGAYSPKLTYSMDDISALTAYAADRGVRLLPEIDVPGHAASWTAGYPDVMADCFVKYSYNINDFALNPTKDETYTVVGEVVSDIIGASGVKNFHLGGDEVVYGCWANDTSIVNFMDANGMTSYDQLLEYFVLKADDITRALGATPVHWEEVFKAGCDVGSDVIFQVWTSMDVVSSIVAKGFQVIAAPSDVWYLDHADNTWDKMYSYDPTVGLSETEAQLIIGGEVCMWGEHIDENNIEGIVYPRAASVGERLWSPSTVVDVDDAEERITMQRCRLINRGFHPGAIQPGFCKETYV
eukprot:CAMPEP_0185024066 /NCGR_PEP_ID=MMETSP1103-20130426/6975_1 /TAXON_ID=36769 /ORGANISM="Paraphysomonas bandaiensis, Strain Caron Lab Isolate" /LENGTH=505 /DNA_ID=CAMNT_0027556915 /DNA_START=40 /DNA_END=1557 /DNA_ORIENTATION=+